MSQYVSNVSHNVTDSVPQNVANRLIISLREDKNEKNGVSKNARNFTSNAV
jgi:hypothetical protein